MLILKVTKSVKFAIIIVIQSQSYLLFIHSVHFLNHLNLNNVISLFLVLTKFSKYMVKCI